MQKMFGLKHRPDRFTRKESAVNFAKKSSDMVVFLDENPDNLIIGYYVICPADFTRLEREAEGIFTNVSLL